MTDSQLIGMAIGILAGDIFALGIACAFVWWYNR